KERPTVGELFEIVNRELQPDAQLDNRLQIYGYYDGPIRREIVNLRYDIPGPADLVRFSVRHVWEPDLLANIGYDEEFPGAVIDYWHAAKGLDYPLFTGPFKDYLDKALGEENATFALANRYAELGISEPTWARAYWWSHWVLPAPGQFFSMLIRLD